MPKYDGELFLLKGGLSDVSKSSNKLFLRFAGNFLRSSLKGRRTIANLITKFNQSFEIRPKGANFIVCVDPVDDSHHVIYKELFCDKIYDLSKVDFVPETIVDCGAHIGLFTVLANKTFLDKPSFAFEPNQHNVKYLRENCRRNNLGTQIFSSAVSDYDGYCSFRYSYSYAGALDETVDDDESKVPVVNFVEFIRKLGRDNLLLKMDIEGEEEKLLPKILEYLPERTAIFFETHLGLEKFNQMAIELKKFNFETEIIRERGLYIDAFAKR